MNKIGPLAALLAGLCVSAAHALPAGVTWDWQLQAPLDLLANVNVLALDPDEEQVTPDVIATLQDRGVFTICYVSVGTSEEWRADAPDFPDDVLGADYAHWPGERFVDIRDPRVMAIMEARFANCAAMGFDAIEPDNIDLHINDTGFDLNRLDVIAYVHSLAEIAHGMGMEIAQKNAGDLTAALAPVLDFAMAENCIEDGWCEALLPYLESGRAVLAAEYQGGRHPACAYAASLGLSLILKTRDLNRIGSNCTGRR